MLDPADATSALVIGAILGARFVALAYRIHRWTRGILASALAVAALAYVLFAGLAGESSEWLRLELAGVALYGTMAALGLRGSTWWLVAGWTLHPVWDVALHYFGPGVAFAPTWWTVPCLGWDLVAAGYIASRGLPGTHPVGTTAPRPGAA
ncbi:MAG TPA: DUF6010 family protein [Gemmatimonadales bacterium]|nr:DUF6010 family protein [Gemmatimonadales bacterium]